MLVLGMGGMGTKGRPCGCWSWEWEQWGVCKIGQVYRIREGGMGEMGIEIRDLACMNLEEEKPSFK